MYIQVVEVISLLSVVLVEHVTKWKRFTYMCLFAMSRHKHRTCMEESLLATDVVTAPYYSKCSSGNILQEYVVLSINRISLK